MKVAQELYFRNSKKKHHILKFHVLVSLIILSFLPSKSMIAIDVELPSNIITFVNFNSLKTHNLSFTAFKIAVDGHSYYKSKGVIQSDTVVIIDFDLPSYTKRMFIVDLNTMQVLDSSLVAHGKNTGDIVAKNFSNKNGSLKSSLGFYLTNEQYEGKHGLSLRLDGLEKGVNSNARARNIVIHKADYVSQEFIHSNHRIGRSFGCPAIPEEGYEMRLKFMAKSTLIYMYSSKRKNVYPQFN